MKFFQLLNYFLRNLLFFSFLFCYSVFSKAQTKVWETVELKFESSKNYENPYTDVEFWVELKGPGFSEKVFGFWDGGQNFKVRLLSTSPGEWNWKSFSYPFDSGLSGKEGKFTAVEATSDEINKNPNLRGIIRTNPNAPHGFIYADKTPFFMLADTWWAAATWRYPYKGGKEIPEDYIPEENNWSFEGGIQWLKKHGYNSIGVISCFPNWKVDQYGFHVKDDNGVTIRNADAWGKAPLGEKIKDMHDENGNMPFLFPGKCKGKENVCANFDRINPLYWQSFDKKMDYLWEQAFVPYIETIRRDQLPVWIEYHDFNESFARFLNYVRARYGTYNFIFSLAHLDVTSQKGVNITQLKEAFLYYHTKYGKMPFGQPVTAMIGESTLKHLGHIDDAPYLTCHSGGNVNRGHGILAEMESMFNAEPAVPVFNNEPYYPLINLSWSRAGGVVVEPGDELDNYFGRSHMYSNFFSGTFAGYVFGTGAFGGDSTGEPPYIGEPAKWPKIWDALKIDALKQGAWYRKFINSLGYEYQKLIPTHHLLSSPRNKTETLMDWSYMLKSTDNKLILLYFERNAKKQVISGIQPKTRYTGVWYNPRNGDWIPMRDFLTTNEQGKVTLPPFPNGNDIASDDWAAKLVVK